MGHLGGSTVMGDPQARWWKMDDLGYPHIVVDIMVPMWYIIGILGYIGILIPIMYSDIHIYYD